MLTAAMLPVMELSYFLKEVCDMSLNILEEITDDKIYLSLNVSLPESYITFI